MDEGNGRIGMETGYMAAILSNDMSKAFDSMHPMLLLAKFKAYGLSQEALSLMRSYFSDRRNRTKLDNVTSTSEDITTERMPASVIAGASTMERLPK